MFLALRPVKCSVPVILPGLATGVFEVLSPLPLLAQAGYITTVAGNGTIGYRGDGGPATSAELYSPEDAVLDNSGNLYIADTFNNVVRMVSATSLTFASLTPFTLNSG